MTGKLLTLIIPSYNMEKYLDRCLSSLVVDDEHMNMFEALIINDGSKDRTSEIGHKYEAKYPGSFRVIDKTNGHYGSCVNCGLSEAKGTFIKVLDADDSFATEVFSSFLDFLMREEVKYDADLVLSDYSTVDENGVVQCIHHFAEYTSPFSIEQITWQDRESWFIHGLTYRTSLLKAIGYQQTEGISYTDEEWIVKPLKAVHFCYRFHGSLYQYTVGREGQSMAPDVYAKSLGMRLTVAQSILSFYETIKQEGSPFSVFVQGRLTSVLNHIYHTTLLLETANRQSLEALRIFDNELALSDTEIHSAIDRVVTIAGFRFRPIRVFREGKKGYLMAIRSLYSITNQLNSFRRHK